MPKFLLGLPSDMVAKALENLRPKARQTILTKSLKILTGDYASFGLPPTTKPVLSQHPTVNSDLIDYVRHGKIKPKPAIKKLMERRS